MCTQMVDLNLKSTTNNYPRNSILLRAELLLNLATNCAIILTVILLNVIVDEDG